MNYAQGDSTNTTLQNDIRAATDMGVDAFALDVFSASQAKPLLTAFIAAADSIGASQFKFLLSADMARQFPASDIVSVMEAFADNPHYLKLNGAAVLSTYGGTNLGNAWWQSGVLTPLRQAGIQVVFVPYFDRSNPNADSPTLQNWIATIQRFPSVNGLFNFLIPGSTPFYSTDPNIGRHWWSILEGDEALAQALQSSGQIYMASAMPYYWAVCHPFRQYMEFQGGRGMDNLWTSIITKQHPNLVQLVTWNDYSESTYVEPTHIPPTQTAGIPSLPHLGYAELLKYYISWYHKGAKPTITRDAVFFFNRTHPKDAIATNDSSVCNLGPVSAGQRWGLLKDVIYVTTALTAPAELIVQIGSYYQTYQVPTGLTTTDVPFVAGSPRVELWRNGKKIAGIAGNPIVADPVVYNFNVDSGFAVADGPTSDTWQPQADTSLIFAPHWFVEAGKKPNPPTSVAAH
jgi:hypothetical protein